MTKKEQLDRSERKKRVEEFADRLASIFCQQIMYEHQKKLSLADKKNQIPKDKGKSESTLLHQ